LNWSIKNHIVKIVKRDDGELINLRSNINFKSAKAAKKEEYKYIYKKMAAKKEEYKYIYKKMKLRVKLEYQHYLE